MGSTEVNSVKRVLIPTEELKLHHPRKLASTTYTNKVPNYSTLPHFSRCRVLLTAHRNAVAHKDVLRHILGENIRRLQPCTDRKDLDETLPYVLPEMMVAHVDMLGSWAHLGQSGELESA